MAVNYTKVIILGNYEKEKEFLLHSLSETLMIETDKVKVSCYQKYALWLVREKNYYGGADKAIILHGGKGKSVLDWHDEVRKSLGQEVGIYHLYGNKEQKLVSVKRILL
ncbi:Hypothetical protein ZAZAV_352 [Cedratvirus Zaza IHUMI]|uniref:Uncharacterized protein n=1 Tax=Cedratvirus Zaza IHUMI TaxID=2126979 RepID=A0A2R8FFA1_9VIRU|nr:Hypothetical protein ZAZAV_352 [Cedratvirus Zaza IHUMI]